MSLDCWVNLPARFGLRWDVLGIWLTAAGDEGAIVADIDRAAKLAAIPAGASPANRRSPVTVVVITSNGEGDQSVESLVVKAPEGWGVPVRSVQGGEQPGRP